MAEYMTEQKRILKKILEDNADSAYTVEELMEKLSQCSSDRIPGKSTVYRLITHLTEERTVKKFLRNGSRKFAYQIELGEHCDCHLHLKCMECGKLIHLDEDTSDALLGKVRDISNFSVNEEATVLFGECSDCGVRKHNKKGIR